MTLRVLLVDDEAPARARLRQLLAEIGGCTVVAEASDGADALDQVGATRPDVVLLDVRMPGMDGMAVGRRLAEGPTPAVVFVTAHGDHALEAFDAEPLDYLLKPVRRDRLARALDRARRRVTGAPADAPPEASDSGHRQNLLCRRTGVETLIPVDAIIYLQADSKYVTVVHDDGEDLVEESLRQLEGAFPDRFLRTHRSVLVARDRLLGLERDAMGRARVVLRGSDARLPISRRHLGELRRLLDALSSV